MSSFFALPLVVIFAVSIVASVAAIELGRRLGRIVGRRGGDNVATLEAAILGLLALIIGFTVAIAIARYDSRREALLNEANAIGTAALRASLLPAPHAAASLALLRDYTAARQKLTESFSAPRDFAMVVERSNAILNELWREAKAAAATNDAMVPTGLYIQSLNELIDDQEKRLSALRNRVPAVVLATLYLIAFVATGFLGYASGLDASRRRAPAHVLGLLIAVVILIIQDLDRPDTGLIVVGQHPLIDAAEALRTLAE